MAEFNVKDVFDNLVPAKLLVGFDGNLVSNPNPRPNFYDQDR